MIFEGDWQRFFRVIDLNDWWELLIFEGNWLKKWYWSYVPFHLHWLWILKWLFTFIDLNNSKYLCYVYILTEGFEGPSQCWSTGGGSGQSWERKGLLLFNIWWTSQVKTLSDIVLNPSKFRAHWFRLTDSLSIYV